MARSTSTEEVRVTTISGAEKGRKLARFDLIPARPLWELAELYGAGAEKYTDHNWREGMPIGMHVAAAMRHLSLFQQGVDIDPETGAKHVIAVAWHMFALAELLEHDELVALFDDRADTQMWEAGRIARLGERLRAADSESTF